MKDKMVASTAAAARGGVDLVEWWNSTDLAPTLWKWKQGLTSLSAASR